MQLTSRQAAASGLSRSQRLSSRRQLRCRRLAVQAAVVRVQCTDRSQRRVIETQAAATGARLGSPGGRSHRGRGPNPHVQVFVCGFVWMVVLLV